MASSFPVSHSFPFLCCFPKSYLLTFHSKVSLGTSLQSLFFQGFLNFRLSFWPSFLLSFFPSEQNSFLLGWRFSQPLPLIVLHSGFPEVPIFCSWIVPLQVFWLFATPLGAWEGHICSSFLVFRGTLFELSQSHFSYATRPEDPEPFGIPAQFFH